MKCPRSSTLGASQPPRGRADEGSPAFLPEVMQQPVDVERQQVFLIELHRVEKGPWQQPDILKIESHGLDRNDRFDLVLARTGGQQPAIAGHCDSDHEPPERQPRRPESQDSAPHRIPPSAFLGWLPPAHLFRTSRTRWHVEKKRPLPTLPWPRPDEQRGVSLAAVLQHVQADDIFMERSTAAPNEDQPSEPSIRHECAPAGRHD